MNTTALKSSVVRGVVGARRRSSSNSSAFTLIEILIVVVILGILAAVVLPQFSNASNMTRENTLKDDLRYLRTQIMVYKAQHRDVAPGYPGGNALGVPTEAAFVAQMTQYSDELGSTSTTPSATYRFGPYLREMPANPLSKANVPNSITMIANGAAIPAANNATGWYYKPQTMEIIANQTGADREGTSYVDY